MGVAERLADEAAEHLHQLRQRRVPRPLAWLMAWRFHADLCRSVLMDDAFDPTIARMLGPVNGADAEGGQGDALAE